jgi:hypothetical protein
MWWPAGVGSARAGATGWSPRSGQRERRPSDRSAGIDDLIVRDHPYAMVLIIGLPRELTGQGLDAGPHPMAWHLDHHQVTASAHVPATLDEFISSPPAASRHGPDMGGRIALVRLD